METFSKAKRENATSMVGNKRARISVYDEPPTGTIALEEFEQFALDRMRVLKVRFAKSIYARVAMF